MSDTITIKHIDDFETFVNSMVLNTRYMLPPTCAFKWAKIEKDTDLYSKEVTYSWAMEYNYTVTGCTGYIFPLKSRNYVASFKTEAGARRNYFKRYVEVFEPIAKEVRERDKKIKAILAV